MRYSTNVKYSHTLGEICRDLHFNLYPKLSKELMARILFKDEYGYRRGYSIYPHKNPQKLRKSYGIYVKPRYYYSPTDSIEYIEDKIQDECVRTAHHNYIRQNFQKNFEYEKWEDKEDYLLSAILCDGELKRLMEQVFDLPFDRWWQQSTINISFGRKGTLTVKKWETELFLSMYYFTQSFILIKRLKQEIKTCQRNLCLKPSKLLKDSEILSLLR